MNEIGTGCGSKGEVRIIVLLLTEELKLPGQGWVFMLRK